ncbi:unnamed protein product, partial [Hapterophycus canaliculatus]
MGNFHPQDTHSGINHVLEQITDLFADEPDLLREFTYFLPDTVQAQAKERLDRAAVEAEIRLGRAQSGRAQRLPAHRSHGGPQRGRVEPRGRQGNSSRDQSRGHRTQQRVVPGGNSLANMARQGRKGRQMWSHAQDYELGPDGVFKGPKKRTREPDDASGAGQGRGWSSADSHGTTIKTSPANQLFDQARDVLSSSGDDTDWTEFLKCLDLFSNEILGRDELLDMVHDLFEAH